MISDTLYINNDLYLISYINNRVNNTNLTNNPMNIKESLLLLSSYDNSIIDKIDIEEHRGNIGLLYNQKKKLLVYLYISYTTNIPYTTDIKHIEELFLVLNYYKIDNNKIIFIKNYVIKTDCMSNCISNCILECNTFQGKLYKMLDDYIFIYVSYDKKYINEIRFDENNIINENKNEIVDNFNISSDYYFNYNFIKSVVIASCNDNLMIKLINLNNNNIFFIDETIYLENDHNYKNCEIIDSEILDLDVINNEVYILIIVNLIKYKTAILFNITNFKIEDILEKIDIKYEKVMIAEMNGIICIWNKLIK